MEAPQQSFAYLIDRTTYLFFLLYIIALAFPFIRLQAMGVALEISDLIFIPFGIILFIRLLFLRKVALSGRDLLPVVFYFLALSFSVVFSDDLSASLKKLVGEIYLFCVFITTALVVTSLERLRQIAQLWLAAACIVSIYGLLAIAAFYFDPENAFLVKGLHHIGSLPSGNYPRIQSTFLYPAMLCSYLTVALGMAFILFRANPSSPYLILVVLLISLAAIFTLTPGLGGFILSLCVLLYCMRIPNSLPRPSLILVYVGLFIAISSVLISAYPPWDISSAIVNSDGTRTFYSLGPRALTWYDAFRTFLEYPFTGKGLGLGVASVYYQSASGRGAILTDAHNTWLNVAAQGGLLGLIAIICLTVNFLAKSIRLIRDKSFMSPLGAVFIGAFLAQGFVGSFENARHLWVLLGLLVAGGHIMAKESDTGSRSE